MESPTRHAPIETAAAHGKLAISLPQNFIEGLTFSMGSVSEPPVERKRRPARRRFGQCLTGQMDDTFSMSALQHSDMQAKSLLRKALPDFRGAVTDGVTKPRTPTWGEVYRAQCSAREPSRPRII
jgi:hypothetical protein